MKNTIYNEDCLETMARMPDNFIDLTVTSPPYDLLRDYKGYSFDFEKIAKELFRVTKEGGVVVWVVNDSTINGGETLTSFKQAIYFQSIGFKMHDTMIYQKKGCCMPSHNRYLSNFEYMFVLCKGKLKTANLIKDRKNRFRYRWGKGRKVRNKDGSFSERSHYEGKEFGARYNVWQYHNGAGYGTKDDYAFEHPAVFPEALAGDHIISWSNEGDLVYDPFTGSGTTAKMAIVNHRDYIGSEISEDYCKIADKRIKAAKGGELFGDL